MTRAGGRPVVAIDIDGVLRLALPPEGPAPPGGFQVEIVMHRDDYPRRFHRAPEWDAVGESRRRHWLSEIGAEWVRSLLDRGVHVVWASTWGQSANTYFAPPLRIPPLDVATSGASSVGTTVADWKSSELAHAFPGRPLVWIDDFRVSSTTRELDRQRRPADRAMTLSVHVEDPRVGITPSHVAVVEDFLALSATDAGRHELRRRRTNRLARERRQRDRLRGVVFAVAKQFDEPPIVIAALAYEFEHAPPDLDSAYIRARAKRWRDLGGPDFIAVLTAIEEGLRR